MCGIFGYIGNQNAAEILLDGLQRLEYRGYDSSGIGIVTHDHQAVTLKAPGKIQNRYRKREEAKGKEFDF